MADDNRENGAPADESGDDIDDAAGENNDGAGNDVEGAGDDIDGVHPTDDGHATGNGSESGDGADDAEFARRVEEARDLLSEDATAFYVGVVREGREVDSTFAQQANGPQQEGMQALSLLASHVRLVSDEAGVDYTTVAADAVTLAEQLDESE